MSSIDLGALLNEYDDEDLEDEALNENENLSDVGSDSDKRRYVMFFENPAFLISATDYDQTRSLWSVC